MSETDVKKQFRRIIKKYPDIKCVSYSPYPFGTPGTPDYILSMFGFIVLAEIKKPGGKVSAVQKVQIRQWLNAGAMIIIGSTKKELEEKVESMYNLCKLKHIILNQYYKKLKEANNGDEEKDTDKSSNESTEE